MDHELQPQATNNDDGRVSLPALASVKMKMRVMYFGMGFVPMTALFDYMTQGQIGTSAVLGAIAGTTLAYFTPEIHNAIGPGLRIAGQAWAYLNRNNSGRARHRLLDKEWWLTGQASVPYGEPENNEFLEIEQDEREDDQEEEESPPEEEAQGRQRVPKLVSLAPDVTIPLGDLAGISVFIVGMRRSGKTTLGVRIAEQLGKYLIPMLIPDKEGDWLSLGEVLPRGVIFYGPKKDANAYGECHSYRLQLERAEETGYAILDQGYQAILDLDSYATLDEGVAVQVALIRGLLRWAEEHPKERTTCEVFLDEAQRYLPETLDNSIIKDRDLRDSLLELYRDLSGVGGKRGLSPVILSQRFAETNKKIVAQTEVYFILRQTSDNDLDRVMHYVKKITVTREQISAFIKGQGIYVAIDGTQTLTRFYPRESDGSRSHTPSPETAQRYADVPMRMPGLSTSRHSSMHATESGKGAEAAPTRSLLDDRTTDGVTTSRPRLRERSRIVEAEASLSRHPGAGLPKELREALEVLEDGMTYRDLCPALGCDERRAREIWRELRVRGLLRAPGPAGSATERAEAAQAQGQVTYLRPLPPATPTKQAPQIDPADLAKAFALWQVGPQNQSVRKLEDAARAAGYDWSNGKCRDLINEMEKRGLIPKRRKAEACCDAL